MQWIRRFQLFLFDFDGLLVNTEHLHFQAYIQMMAAQGYTLDWSFPQFCELAHLNATSLKEALYAQFPSLSPNWPLLYEQKKRIYFELIGAGKVEMMPGAERLLLELEKAGIQRCVATNSFREQIDLIRSQLKPLQSIPHWITREEYEKPKPHPDCYLQAIQRWGKPGDRIIGFEDSIRGLKALQETPALPVLICSAHHPLLEMATDGAVHFASFEEIPTHWMQAQP